LTGLASLPPELLVIPPLAVAAGVDLYLTLLFLGAATTTSWWDGPLPGALGDLDSLGILIVVGGFYVAEFSAERFPPAALVWNTFHAVIRPLSGGLLALLLLDGQPPLILFGGAIAAGLIASLAHAVRSGGVILRWLSSATHPKTVLVSLLEDVLVIALLTLVLDLPLVALAASVVAAAAGSFGARSNIRAFGFAVRLAAGRAFQTLGQRRWVASDGLPIWIRDALEDDVMAPGGGLRGSRVGVYRLPGAPRFATGWVVVRGDSPLFVFPSRKGFGRVDLGTLVANAVEERGFFRRVDLQSDTGAPPRIFFGLDGPSEESLRSEFLFR